MEFSPRDILNMLTRSRRPRTGREIASALGATSRQKQELFRLLHDLVRQGELSKLHGGKFVLPKQKKPLQGKLQLLRNGSGVVLVADGSREIRVPERALYGAMQGDRVEVVIAGGGRGHKPEGRIIRILEREQKELVGLFQQQQQGEGYVLPVDSAQSAAVRVTGTHPPGLQHDQVVVLQLEAPPGSGQGLSGRIIEILGAADDPDVEMRVIARRFGIPTAFPQEVLAVAHRVQQSVSAEDCRGRRDLRHLPFVTIDGETAKDFDDAVTLHREPSGHYRLSVAIADVAHYVPDNNPIDVEALQRGTSVYLPGTCLPMLPESLSNGICSLNPQVDRLVLVAELQLDPQAVVLDSTFTEAVICSRARLTYTAVQQSLDQHGSTEPAEPHLAQLPVMQELAAKLTGVRMQRGALDLDIPEAEIRLNPQGQPTEIVRSERTQAHRLIEEFMLAANEAVATALTNKGFPLLYRVHEPPAEQDLEPFFRLARRLGVPAGLPRDSLLTRLQRVLDFKTEAAQKGILNRMLLRSLKQACYQPENRGHFGLASEHYCHFTSPIRRYPDLLVHRMLKQMLTGADAEQLAARMKKKLVVLAEQTSKAERRAIDAERDASAMKTCQYMLKHIGETHPGHVTSVHPFGFFVELDTVFVEGLVHVSSLGDTYYRYDEEANRLIGEGNNVVYSIGTPVSVTVRDVNVQRREIDLNIEQGPVVTAGASFRKRRKRN